MRLKNRTTPTIDLVLASCSELARHQEAQRESGNAALGHLQFSVGYLMDSNALEVTVIQGKGFPKDLNGTKYCV